MITLWIVCWLICGVMTIGWVTWNFHEGRLPKSAEPEELPHSPILAFLVFGLVLVVWPLVILTAHAIMDDEKERRLKRAEQLDKGYRRPRDG